MVRIDIVPLTEDRWPDLVSLFGRRGAAIPGRCWCMYYRRRGIRSADQNKAALRALVGRAVAPGLLAYEDETAVGWVSLGPREDYESLSRSPVARPLDDRRVWSIVCFFVDGQARGCGVADHLLRGALDYARSNGATLIEAFPIDKEERVDNEVAFVGTKRMFDRAGFSEVARRRPNRPVMRRALRPRKR